MATPVATPSSRLVPKPRELHCWQQLQPSHVTSHPKYSTFALPRLRLPTPSSPCLQALCPSLVSLHQLKLSHVAGLTDAGICGLSCLTGLTELCVLAPSNKAVSQDSLAALAPLRDVR
jgi:hypothetical protein